MEEQKKEIEEQESSQKAQNASKRSTFLLFVAGVYLLYTGYTLCKSVLDGQDGAGWGFFIVGVIFLVIGVVMLFYGVKNSNAAKAESSEAGKADASQENDEKEAIDVAAGVPGSAGQDAEAMEHTETTGRPMSIAERAKLASRLADADTDADTDVDADADGDTDVDTDAAEDMKESE